MLDRFLAPKVGAVAVEVRLGPRGQVLGAAKGGLPLYFPLSSENTGSPIILNACRS